MPENKDSELQDIYCPNEGTEMGVHIERVPVGSNFIVKTKCNKCNRTLRSRTERSVTVQAPIRDTPARSDEQITPQIHPDFF